MTNVMECTIDCYIAKLCVLIVIMLLDRSKLVNNSCRINYNIDDNFRRVSYNIDDNVCRVSYNIGVQEVGSRAILHVYGYIMKVAVALALIKESFFPVGERL